MPLTSTRPELTGSFGMVAAPTGWPRRPACPCWSAAATPSTPRSPPVSCCRSSSRTSTARAATCRSSCGATRDQRVARGLRPGAGARRGDRSRRSPTSGLTSSPAPGLLAAVVPGAFGALDALLRALGHLVAARRPGAGDRLRPGRLPGAARVSAPRSRALADTVRARVASRPPPRTSSTAAHPRAWSRLRLTALADDLPADPRRGRGGRPGPRGAARGGPRRLVPGLRRRGDRRVLPRPRVARHLRRAARAGCSPATTWPAGRPPSRSR